MLHDSIIGMLECKMQFIALLFISLISALFQRRDQPRLVETDNRRPDDENIYHHINPAYEFQDIDHIQFNVKDSTDQSARRATIEQEERRFSKLSEVAIDPNDHRYSSYIETVGDKEGRARQSCQAGDDINDRDSGCDESGIGSEEYHFIPHRESTCTIDNGLDQCPDIEHYGCSIDESITVNSQDDVYQEIPYDQEETGPRLPPASKARGIEDSSNALAIDTTNMTNGSTNVERECGQEPMFDADEMVDNELYIPFEEGQLKDSEIDEGSCMGKRDTDCRSCEIRDNSDAQDAHEEERLGNNDIGSPDNGVPTNDSIYDDTAPSRESLYVVLEPDESGDDNGTSQDIEPTSNAYSRSCLSDDGRNGSEDDLYDDTVTETKSDRELGRVEKTSLDLISDIAASVQHTTKTKEDTSNHDVVDETDNEPVYHAVYKNESDDEECCENGVSEIRDNAKHNNIDKVNDTTGDLSMIDNELYRPLSVVLGGSRDSNSICHENTKDYSET